MGCVGSDYAGFFPSEWYMHSLGLFIVLLTPGKEIWSPQTGFCGPFRVVSLVPSRLFFTVLSRVGENHNYNYNIGTPTSRSEALISESIFIEATKMC